MVGASSTPKTCCHDIAEILLKVALNTINQSVNQYRIKMEDLYRSRFTRGYRI
jgi:hypothetical protein